MEFTNFDSVAPRRQKGIALGVIGFVVELFDNYWHVKNREGVPIVCGYTTASRDEFLAALKHRGAAITIDRASEALPYDPDTSDART